MITTMAYIKFAERASSYKYKDETTYKDLLRYCSNPEKSVAAGTFHLKSLATAAAEMQYTAQQFHKDYGTRIQHIIIAFAKKETPTLSMVQFIADACGRFFADRYQVVYCIHWEPNPHIHMIVNRVSFVDGKKYLDRFADRQAFWQHVRYVLNGYGIFLCK